MSAALRVGLTGGIGSGKSTVKKYFDELGVPTVDADDISRRITRPGEAAFDEIVTLFGEEILDNSGKLRRQRLRELIFTDPSLKTKLEAIIHPRVRQKIQTFINQVNYPYCIICIPLLLEIGGQTTVDRVLVVDAPEELQVARVSLRDETNENQTRNIIKTQISRAERLSAADDIIVNKGSFEDLKKQVGRFHNIYIELTRQKNNN